jgi:ribosomal protein S18 acetylase RimI-like enzyme
MNTIIRKASETDFDQVYPLFGQLWPNKELDRILRMVFNRGIHSETDELFCIEYSEKLVGFCAYAVVNNLWQAGSISYMYAMVVDENFRGKGLGTLLIKAAIDDSKAKGMQRMELDSAFHREKAHQFYQKLGFEKRAFLFSYPL